VCGTEQDPQDRARIIADLHERGVLVASTNAEAAVWSAAIAAQRQEMPA
jgi:FdrA protein